MFAPPSVDRFFALESLLLTLDSPPVAPAGLMVSRPLLATLHRATVKRSLILGADHYGAENAERPRIGIDAGSVIENAIVDKNARIGRDVHITNERGLQEGSGPGWVIRDGIVMIIKDALIPDGTRI